MRPRIYSSVSWWSENRGWTLILNIVELTYWFTLPAWLKCLFDICSKIWFQKKILRICLINFESSLSLSLSQEFVFPYTPGGVVLLGIISYKTFNFHMVALFDFDQTDFVLSSPKSILSLFLQSNPKYWWGYPCKTKGCY